MKYLLLLIPCLLALWVPLFNSTDPQIFGFPFFYWFQMVMIPVSSIFIYLVYRGDSANG
jgi:hypothetical protein